MRSVLSMEPELHIDLSAIAENFLRLKRLVGPGTEIAAVVKSDAYGLGIDRVTAALVEAGCGRVVVANLREAIDVRRTFASLAHIYILSGADSADLETCLTHRVTPVCHSLADALAACRRLPEFVVNIDTGFSRFGLTFAEARALAHMTQRKPELVLSHLACADAPDDPTNRLQRDRFVAMCQLLNPHRRSLGASATVWLDRKYHFDLVRTGSALFGLNNAGVEPNPLLPVVQLLARIAGVRAVHRGETVGYAGSFRAPRPMRIGIVTLGYAAGLPWTAGNAVAVAIGSHIVPIVGRVAMEYVAIDLTDIPQTQGTVGQVVEFLGPRLSVEAMAKAARTVPQEILVRLGAACSRQYTRLDETRHIEVPA